MADIKFETGKIAPGSEVTMTNTPTDARSVFVDGLKGMTIQSHVTKISFFEQLLDPSLPDQMFGKFVVNLVIPNDQFIAIAKLLKDVADQMVALGAINVPDAFAEEGIAPLPPKAEK